MQPPPLPPPLPLDVVVRERSSFGRAQSGWRGRPERAREITALLKSGTNDEIGRTERAQGDGRAAAAAAGERKEESELRESARSLARSLLMGDRWAARGRMDTPRSDKAHAEGRMTTRLPQ